MSEPRRANHEHGAVLMAAPLEAARLFDEDEGDDVSFSEDEEVALLVALLRWRL